MSTHVFNDNSLPVNCLRIKKSVSVRRSRRSCSQVRICNSYCCSIDDSSDLASDYLTWGVKVGAEKTSKYVVKYAQSQKKGEKCDQAVVVDPRVRSSVHYIRKGAKVAVKVSGYLGEKFRNNI